MNLSQFRLYGDSEIERVRQHLQSVVREWAEEWLATSVVQVDVRRDFLPSAGSADWRRVGPAEDFTLALLCPQSWVSRIKPLLTGMAPDESVDGEIRSALAETLLTTLLDRLAGDSDVAASPQHTTSVDVGGPGTGRLAASVTLGAGVSLELVLGRPLLARWTEGAACETGQSAPLVSLREGLEAESVAVEVVVGSAELSLAELQSLSVGDVLRLDRGIKDPLMVMFDGGQGVCGAHLGAVRGRRAVQLAAT